MSIYKLTVAIPTYKRPDLLYKTIKSILVQSQPIRVLVCDDSVSNVNDVTYSKINEEFSDAEVSIIRNEINLGIDDNIVKCITASDTDYVWLLGEDDLLTENSIEKVLAIINSSDYPFVFANYIYSNSDFSKTSRQPVISNLSSGEVFFDDFVVEYAPLMGFIGGCVVNRSGWLSTDYKKYQGSFYSHVGGIIDSSIGQNIYFIHDLLVLNRAEDVSTFTWSSQTFDVYFSFYKVLESSQMKECGIYSAVVNTSLKFFKVKNLGWLIAKRADGVYDNKIYNRFYKTHSIGFRFFAWLISIMPRFLFKPIRSLHLKRKFQ